MDLQTLINQRVNDNTHTLEVYGDEVLDIIFLEATISEPVVNFVTDVDCNKFNFPDTVSTIDIDAYVPNLNLTFNIPKSIEQIYVRNKNIKYMNLMELFPFNVKYRYVQCNLDNTNLNILINKRYKKYFNCSPHWSIIGVANQKILNNMIYSRFHKTVIDEIRTYEERIKQAKEFSTTIKSELVAAANHPDRIERILEVSKDYWYNLDKYI